jgi:AcrR family transcriptional regulator
MARPVVIRDETIVDAARQVFLERGFKATTLEVAERAGVSEGTLFKRFNSKIELFQAAMRTQIDDPPYIRALQDLRGIGEVKDNLVDVGLQLIRFFREVLPLMMMSWSNPCGGEGAKCFFGEDGKEPLALRGLRAMTEFLEAEAIAGRLRRHDAEVAARAFLGAIHNFVAFELLFKDHPPKMTADRFVADLVDTLWNGFAPDARVGEGVEDDERDTTARSSLHAPSEIKLG